MSAPVWDMYHTRKISIRLSDTNASMKLSRPLPASLSVMYPKILPVRDSYSYLCYSYIGKNWCSNIKRDCLIFPNYSYNFKRVLVVVNVTITTLSAILPLCVLNVTKHILPCHWWVNISITSCSGLDNNSANRWRFLIISILERFVH